MNIAYLCDKGLLREENEDSIWVDDIENLFMVSDGMGGHEKGCVASTMVIDCFRMFPKEFNQNKWDKFNKKSIKSLLQVVLNKHVEKVTKSLYSYAYEHLSKNEILGATIAGLYKVKSLNKWMIFHLGDSRVYKFSSFKLTQLTSDHTVSQFQSHTLNKAIGNFPIISLEINYLNIKKNDFLILCSDGVSDYLSNDELFDLIVKYYYSLALLCQYLKELIYKRGAKDNLSIIILEVGVL